MANDNVKDSKKKRSAIAEAKRKASERVKGKNIELAAVCFLSDLGLIAFIVVMGILVSSEVFGEIKPYKVAVSCAACIVVWLTVRAFTGELKRRVFYRALNDKKAEKKELSFGLYIIKYVVVILSACLLLLTAAAVNAVYFGAEEENGNVFERLRRSRLKSKGFVGKAILLTLSELYKLILPAIAIFGAVSLCFKISSAAARAVVIALSTVTVAAVTEFLYARYRMSLTMLYELCETEKNTEDKIEEPYNI